MVQVLASTAFSMGIVNMLKMVMHVPRPADMLVAETDFRFPSGHAAMASVFMVLAWVYVHRHVQARWARIVLYVVASLWLATIGFARIYLHAHYLIDVVVGAGLGIGTTALVFFFSTRILKK
jgi:membrane-associated phospholipid phosphatase